MPSIPDPEPLLLEDDNHSIASESNDIDDALLLHSISSSNFVPKSETKFLEKSMQTMNIVPTDSKASQTLAEDSDYLNSNMESLRSDLEDSHEKSAALISQMRVLRDSNQILTQSLVNAQNDYRDLSQTFNRELEKRVSEKTTKLNESLNFLHNDCERLRSRIREMEDIFIDKESSLLFLQAQYELASELVSKSNDAKSELEVEKQISNELKLSLEAAKLRQLQLENKSALLESKNASLTSALQNAKDELASVNKLFENKTMASDIHLQKINDLKSQLAASMIELEKSQMHCTTLLTKSSTVQMEAEAAVKCAKESKIKLELCAIENEKLSNKLDEVKSELEQRELANSQETKIWKAKVAEINIANSLQIAKLKFEIVELKKRLVGNNSIGLEKLDLTIHSRESSSTTLNEVV
jgi:hypothetical protein